MNIIYAIIIIFCIYHKAKTEDYETIKLDLISNDFYIPIKIDPQKRADYFILSLISPMHFFPSENCTICRYHIISNKDASTYPLISQNKTVPYYYYDYTGIEYQTNLTLGTQKTLINFIAFNKMSIANNYQGKGRFALSFLNYNFNTNKKQFAILINEEDAILHLGGYNPEIIEYDYLFKSFNVTIDSNDSTDNINKTSWYINFNNIYINNRNIGQQIKFSFDISYNRLYIPKNFFFDNVEYIFPEESNCQVQPEGYFICECYETYYEQFADFKFISENGTTIMINTSDYIMFDSGLSDNICYVLIDINYENDVFIAGRYSMNNFYSIFDVDNMMLKLYQVNVSTGFQYEDMVVFFFFIMTLGALVSISCYFCYKRYYSVERNLEIENENEVNLVQRHDNEVGDNNMLNLEERRDGEGEGEGEQRDEHREVQRDGEMEERRGSEEEEEREEGEINNRLGGREGDV